MKKTRRSRASRGNIADLTNPLRHGAAPPKPPAAEPAGWVEGAPGWRIDRSICEAGAPVLVELVHEDGRRLALVPQEAALRALAQNDPLGRFVGSAFAEVFTAFRRLDKGVPPQQVTREARAHGAVAVLDIAAETLADRAAKGVVARNPDGKRYPLHPDCRDGRHPDCRDGRHRAREAAVLHKDTHATCYRCGASVRKDDPLLTIEPSVACRPPR